MGYVLTPAIYLLSWLAVITIIISVHELGHYFAARLCGVKIERASLGFGPALLSRTDKRGVIWQLSWIPFGGYVKFAGDANAAGVPDAEDLEGLRQEIIEHEGPGAEKKYYHFKPVWQRAFIAVAGPTSNFALSILIFAMVAAIFGQDIILPRVAQVTPNSPAAAAGFQPGDVFKTIAGRPIHTTVDAQEIISLNSDTPLKVVIDRGGKTVDLTVTPRRTVIKNRIVGEQKLGMIGIAFDEKTYRRRSENPLEAVQDGADTTWRLLRDSLTYIGRIFTGKESGDQLGGPIRTIQLAGAVAQASAEGNGGIGLKSVNVALGLLQLTASISVAVGFLNLLPIPVLDGGHLLFYGYEAVARRPLGARVQAVGFQVGLALLVGLMLFATWNDLQRLHVFKIVGGLFS
jgi:regulator of sigma E protease